MRLAKRVAWAAVFLMGLAIPLFAQQDVSGAESAATCGTRKIEPSEIYAGYECPQGNSNCGTHENIRFTVGTFPYQLEGCETFFWDLRGSWDSGRNQVGSYSAVGEYVVAVAVNNSFGFSKTTFPISIVREGSAPPGVEFKWVPSIPYVGTVITFSAAGEKGAPVLSWNWSFGDGTHDTGQVVNHTFTDAGNFSVSVIGMTDSGPSWVNHTVTVYAPCVPPFIETQPKSLSVDPGAPASISVLASGTANLRYQWYEGPTGDVSKPIAGASGSAYFLSAVKESKELWVRVSNGCGVADSDTATIMLTGPCVAPVITSQTVAAVIEPFRSTKLYVQAEGTPPITHQWWRGGLLIAGATGLEHTTGPLAESATYEVRVNSPCGASTSSPIKVHVGPPRRPAVERPD